MLLRYSRNQIFIFIGNYVHLFVSDIAWQLCSIPWYKRNHLWKVLTKEKGIKYVNGRVIKRKAHITVGSNMDILGLQ